LRTLRRRMTGEEPMKPGPRKGADVAQFHVKNGGSRQPQAPASSARSANQSRTAVEEAPAEDHIAEIIAAATTADEPPVEATAPEPPAPEPEVDFTEAEKPAKIAPVKHVKVRSTIDVMAELEALRKRATTQAAPKSKKDPAVRRRREVQKDMTVRIPADVLARTKKVEVTLSFENTDGEVAHEQKKTLELEDTADVDSVSVNLRIEEK
ncbi:MAG: hypothetical protein ACXW2Q_13425, partial [Thermoanaerobaculia bacterium]